MLANRLGQIVSKVIAESQTAFIKERYIMEGIILHETVHEVNHRKMSGLLLKIDFEKAYDKVKWPFLYQMMQAKGFGDIWCDWIMKTVRGGRVAIKVNDQIGPYFSTFKGVRQGDPLSPLLFNLVADGLAMLIKKAQQQGIRTGLVPHLVDGGLAILQYVDDTIFLLEDNLVNARNLKFILCVFEQISGLKINFHKSELFCLGGAMERQVAYSEIFTCGVGSFPIKYLGIPVDVKRLSNARWKPIEEKVEKKLAGWKGNILSIGGRVVLTNACLSTVPLDMLSFLEAPKGVLKRLDYFRARLLWQETQDKRKYHLVNWPSVCLPKDSGGLGILDLASVNQSLLCKWLWKLENSDGVWQRLLYRKYLQKHVLSKNWRRAGESHFWQGLMGVNLIFQQFTRRIVGNGAKTQFWEDVWLGECSLVARFSRLYHITFTKHVTVKLVVDHQK